MCEKLAERKQRELDAIEGKHRDMPSIKPDTRIVSDSELFNMMGNKVKVVKK
jgi:hypothetical protein